MAKRGLPYMGSKGNIADELIRVFPKAENFYDLFGGGFSITHAMLARRPGDYKHFHFNEIRPGICQLIKDAIAGKYNYDVFKPKWVEREEFFAKKELDAYIKMCWSFGNNGEGYLFSKEIEPYKKSMHNAIVFNELDDLAKQVLAMDKFKDGYTIPARRLFLRNKIEYYRKTKIPEVLHHFLNEAQRNQLTDNLRRLEQLERLERLERLQRLEQLERLSFYEGSYEKVPIKQNSIIYCDIPYQGTADYGEFNHKMFFDWAANQKCPVFISEYNIEDKRFKLIWQMNKRSMFSPNKDNCIDKKEKLYVNEAGRKMLDGENG